MTRRQNRPASPRQDSKHRSADRKAPPNRLLRVVITAGPTREFLDSVRFISNPSSGKMGYAIAEAAAVAGHRVTLVSGPADLAPPKGVKVVRVVTAAEMAAATKQAFAAADAAIFAAAVCDYRPRRRADRKLPKKTAVHRIEFEPTEDIAAACGRVKGRRITICFALEDHAARRHAERKLLRKNCDAIVLNSPDTVGSDRASVEFLIRGGRWQRWAGRSKKRLAARLMACLEQLSTSRRPGLDSPTPGRGRSAGRRLSSTARRGAS